MPVMESVQTVVVSPPDISKLKDTLPSATLTVTSIGVIPSVPFGFFQDLLLYK
jgi:hypothetical protein